MMPVTKYNELTSRPGSYLEDPCKGHSWGRSESRRTPQETAGRRRTATGRPQETCKSPKNAIGHLENLNCTQINQLASLHASRYRPYYSCGGGLRQTTLATKCDLRLSPAHDSYTWLFLLKAERW